LSELNLRCSYSFNETFGFYASLNNILNRKQEIFYNYPIQGINVMAGVNINF
jgi:outer membrane cobalamin receptor